MRIVSMTCLSAVLLIFAGCATHTEPPTPEFRHEPPVRIGIVNNWSEAPREVYIATFFTHNDTRAVASELDLGEIAVDRIRRAIGDRAGVELDFVPSEEWEQVTGSKLKFRRINPSGDRIFESYTPDLEQRIRDFGADSGFDIIVHLQSNRSAGSDWLNRDVRHWGAVTQGFVKSPSHHYAYHHLTVRLHSVDPPYYMGDGTPEFLDFETLVRLDHPCQEGVRERVFEQCRDLIERIVFAQVMEELDYALGRLAAALRRN